MSKLLKFNVNEKVWVRLNDHGKQLLGDTRKFSATEDADGWSRWQLWDLMATFGPHIYLGCRVPFETDIRLTADKLKPVEEPK